MLRRPFTLTTPRLKSESLLKNGTSGQATVGFCGFSRLPDGSSNEKRAVQHSSLDDPLKMATFNDANYCPVPPVPPPVPPPVLPVTKLNVSTC